MIIRRRAIATLAAFMLAGAAAHLDLADASPPQASREQADRDLMLRLADGFRRQTWTLGGHTWDEHSDTITLRVPELVRLTLVNDTRDPVELPAAGPFAGTSLGAGEIKSVTLRVNRPAAFDLVAISHGGGLTKACTRHLRRFEFLSG
jgi:hypothetical protein